MQINLRFSQFEKIEFLKDLGYEIYDKTVSEWHQWGNHDSQGEMANRVVMFARKPKLSATEYELDRAFEIEIAERLKIILLNHK